MRYGEDIVGGAEYHARMIAEHLKKICEVEVLKFVQRVIIPGQTNMQRKLKLSMTYGLSDLKMKNSVMLKSYCT